MKNSSHIQRKQTVANGNSSSEMDERPLSAEIQQNIDYIHYRLHSPGDLITKEIELGALGHRCVLMNIDGIVDKNLVHQHLMKPIIQYARNCGKDEVMSAGELMKRLKDEALPLEEVNVIFRLDDAIYSLLSGDTCVFMDGTNYVLVIGSKCWERRAIEEPQTESVIRGPKDGFTEDIRVNSSLVRRRLKDPGLRMDSYMLGRRGKQEIIICYIEDIANVQLIEEVKRRVQTIDVDHLDGSGYIEQWITDSFLSPFPQIMNTERPDRFVSSLLEGKVGIIVDGTPFQLIMPISISSVFKSPEDYYQHWLVSSLIRLLRFGAAFTATFLPAFYIALAEYHHGMIPSNIAFSIASAREGVPFPVFIEALLMETTLEILREAGVRLPKPIGQTIGIVGGLVIGEAAVSAGIVSPVMVIVVAVTAIASFTLPSYSFGIVTRILRFMIMIAAATLGLFGVILAFLMVSIHLVNLKSFGVPYLTPISPMFPKDWRDFIFRAPVTFLRTRPEEMRTQDKTKME